MEYSCTIEKLRIILSKPVEEFNQLIQDGNEELVINILCALKNENIDKVIVFIKNNERIGEGNILNNLLQLEPFSLPIIDEFIKSGFLDEDEFIERVDKVRKVTSHILETLKAEKLKIRKGINEEKNATNSSADLLQQVINEVEKHSDKLKNLKEKQKNDRELETLKSQILEIEKELEVENIEEMNEKLKYYQNRKKEIDKIKIEITNSKALFVSLPKDGA